jgi:guanylate kinase
LKSDGGLLFVVSAPSGAGKTTLCRFVLDKINRDFKRPLKWSCSYTTRLLRRGEKNGRDYFFVREQKFKAMVRAGEFAEWAVVHGHLYGTSLKYLKQAENKGIDLLLEIDCQGARTLRKKKYRGVFIFVLPPSFRELKTRLTKRGTETQEIIERRLQRAAAEVEEYPIYDYIIVNRKFEFAARELEGIILAERSRKKIREKEIKPIVGQFRRK